MPGPVPFQVGDEVSVRIMGKDRRQDLVARSRVVWCKSHDGDAAVRGMGAQFIEISSGGSLLDRVLDDD